jgi:hypothetical protein
LRGGPPLGDVSELSQIAANAAQFCPSFARRTILLTLTLRISVDHCRWPRNASQSAARYGDRPTSREVADVVTSVRPSLRRARDTEQPAGSVAGHRALVRRSADLPLGHGWRRHLESRRARGQWRDSRGARCRAGHRARSRHVICARASGSCERLSGGRLSGAEKQRSYGKKGQESMHRELPHLCPPQLTGQE